jgi:hypothetical protein
VAVRERAGGDKGTSAIEAFVAAARAEVDAKRQPPAAAA